MAAAAREERKAEGDSCADQNADGMIAPLAETEPDINEYPDDDEDYDDDPVIRSLNQISRRNLMPPEWIEHRRKQHYELHALINSIYDALEKGEIESDSDDDGETAAEWSKRLWAGVDLCGINKADGEYAVAVYPACVCPRESCPEAEKKHDAADAEP